MRRLPFQICCACLGVLALPYFILDMKAAPVCEQCTGSGGRSRSAPFPVTQHRQRCDWTAGKGGKKKAIGRKERGETAGDWGIIAAYAGIYTLHIRHVSMLFRSTEPVFTLIQSCCFTNTPPCSCVTGRREESRPNQWLLDRSSFGRPGTETDLFLVRFTALEKQSTEKKSVDKRQLRRKSQPWFGEGLLSVAGFLLRCLSENQLERYRMRIRILRKSKEGDVCIFKGSRWAVKIHSHPVQHTYCCHWLFTHSGQTFIF